MAGGIIETGNSPERKGRLPKWLIVLAVALLGAVLLSQLVNPNDSTGSSPAPIIAPTVQSLESFPIAGTAEAAGIAPGFSPPAEIGQLPGFSTIELSPLYEQIPTINPDLIPTIMKITDLTWWLAPEPLQFPDDPEYDPNNPASHEQTHRLALQAQDLVMEIRMPLPHVSAATNALDEQLRQAQAEYSAKHSSSIDQILTNTSPHETIEALEDYHQGNPDHQRLIDLEAALTAAIRADLTAIATDNSSGVVDVGLYTDLYWKFDQAQQRRNDLLTIYGVLRYHTQFFPQQFPLKLHPHEEEYSLLQEYDYDISMLFSFAGSRAFPDTLAMFLDTYYLDELPLSAPD